jgi:energy-coupling factor transporter transmembrane protein EcfT
MMSSASFTPTTCAWFTAAALLPAALPVPLIALLAVFLILSVLAVGMEGGWRSVRTSAIWMLPISLPLLAVHGIVNPAFPASDTVAGFLPIRHDGLIFAISLAVKLGLFALGVSVWRCVSRDQVFSALVRWRALPQPLLIVVMQAMSLLALVSHRAEAILLAQQARGIPVRGRFLSRLVALPTIVIPLVASTLVDSDARATALISRGLGSGPISWATQADRLTRTDWLFLAGLASVDVGAITALLLR